MNKLPKTLEREPLVDAVFEVRLDQATPLSDVLPGFLLHEFGKAAKVTRLPAADIPFPMRQSDPNLQFAPTQRIELEKFFISVGDRNIVISCKLPYPKWASFKAHIIETMNRIANLDLPGKIERYSVKYVNLIPASTFSDQISKIRMEVSLGDLSVKDQHLSLQVHEKDEDVIHILSVVTGARANMPDNTQAYGVLVDIDSIRNVSIENLASFPDNLEEGLETLRQANKSKFFSCLSAATIEEMGPTYE